MGSLTLGQIVHFADDVRRRPAALGDVRIGAGRACNDDQFIDSKLGRPSCYTHRSFLSAFDVVHDELMTIMILMNDIVCDFIAPQILVALQPFRARFRKDAIGTIESDTTEKSEPPIIMLGGMRRGRQHGEILTPRFIRNEIHTERTASGRVYPTATVRLPRNAAAVGRARPAGRHGEFGGGDDDDAGRAARSGRGLRPVRTHGPGRLSRTAEGRRRGERPRATEALLLDRGAQAGAQPPPRRVQFAVTARGGLARFRLRGHPCARLAQIRPRGVPRAAFRAQPAAAYRREIVHALGLP